MACTAKIRVYPPARADGTTQIRLQVVLDREVLKIPLKVAWPALLVDEAGGQCLTKLPKGEQAAGYAEALAAAKKAFGVTWQQRAEEYSLVLGNALGKASRIFSYFLLNDITPSKGRFMREYDTAASRGDFLLFMERTIEERRKQGKASLATWKNNRSTLNSLKAFRKEIPFSSFTHRFAGEYDAWLVQQGMGVASTRWGRHKDVKVFLKLARLEKLQFEDPYEHFKIKMSESTWKALSPAELAKLEAYYELTTEGSAKRRILQKFLFSCYSSLRLGDLHLLHLARLEGNDLHIKHQKTKRFHKKENVVPLTDRALLYWQHGRAESGGPGFFYYADQYSNRQLQEIGHLLGIEAKLHFHIGRETFATNFIRDGGSVTNLMSIMGHANLKMTMRYVHTDTEMKRADIERLNKVQQARTIIQVDEA